MSAGVFLLCARVLSFQWCWRLCSVEHFAFDLFMLMALLCRRFCVWSFNDKFFMQVLPSWELPTEVWEYQWCIVVPASFSLLHLCSSTCQRQRKGENETMGVLLKDTCRFSCHTSWCLKVVNRGLSWCETKAIKLGWCARVHEKHFVLQWQVKECSPIHWHKYGHSMCIVWAWTFTGCLFVFPTFSLARKGTAQGPKIKPDDGVYNASGETFLRCRSQEEQKVRPCSLLPCFFVELYALPILGLIRILDMSEMLDGDFLSSYTMA